ncbi:uncharacterized protein [Typha angustifolia]|uniref:uncharacterized protein n=1 Tax=Typha angustifolia TaxID=59011 RepID=UPI003C2C80ED
MAQVHIEAIQSAIPRSIVEPGRSRRIAVAATPMPPGALKSRLRVIFYYNKVAEEESAWTVAAWIKESIGNALADQPELAGRLRRGGEADGYWEVKFNDAGVRLVQATAEMTVSEFLALEDREAKEDALAYWVDIDKENPHFSALFYIQVTKFKGDGYSIGISCSVLLADPLFLTNFLKFWAQIHTQMLTKGQLCKNPIFHLSKFQRPDHPKYLKSISLDSVTAAAAATTATATATAIFKVNQTQAQDMSFEAIALLCLREATKKLGVKMTSKFSLVINDESREMQVGSYGDGNNTGLQSPGMSNSLIAAGQWSELGVEELTLVQGNKPIHVSYNVMASADEGFVVIMAPRKGQLMVSVTVAKE